MMNAKDEKSNDFSNLMDLIDSNYFSGERRQSDETLQLVSGSDYHGQFLMLFRFKIIIILSQNHSTMASFE